jgi:hypothetical protein
MGVFSGFFFVCQNDVHHVLMPLLTMPGIFQWLVLSRLGVYLLPRERISMCVRFERDHHIYSCLF